MKQRFEVIDISRTLSQEIAVWPGDTPFSRIRSLKIESGDSVNLSSLSLSAHCGTHVDAPFHFDPSGSTIEKLDLSPFWGPAQVVEVKRSHGPLFPEDLGHVDWLKASRILVKSPASYLPPDQFPEEIVYPSPALAEWLGQQGVSLYGTDAPSMDALDSKTLPGHHALHRLRISILEGLQLAAVEEGLYELVALPLKINLGDGSPVRAVLRSLS